MTNERTNNTSDSEANDELSEVAHTVEDFIAKLEREITELKDSRLRAVADLQNTARRGVENEARARTQGIMGVAHGVIPVLDQFKLALAQTGLTAEQAAEGLKLLQSELWKSLVRVGVEMIEPNIGDAFEPGKHEAVMQKTCDSVDAGAISMRIQNGYRIGDTVLRPAKVAIQPSA
ncbi:MAG: nucleotide exchange factor GrpE [Phycisphaerales bacterium]|nr:nucleotide exchange factor GrpE [Phycisphaerales bacterium]